MVYSQTPGLIKFRTRYDEWIDKHGSVHYNGRRHLGELGIDIELAGFTPDEAQSITHTLRATLEGVVEDMREQVAK